jgi:O-antigen/teichoic acid export membrane protein
LNSDDMIGRLSGPLSLRSRIGAVVALLAGLVGAVGVGLLWATEPALPGRTHLGFGVLVALCLSWAAYGAWTVTRRTPLFALDRVIAGWLAVTATGLLTAAAIAIAVVRGTWVGLAGVAVAAALATAAVVILMRARGRRAELLRRRRELEDLGDPS